ncbi:hypothetical protein FM037_22010 [Shewanella psychropiezotolerans]|nr:hypothetical protein [Shewanella sp. YLB-07]QDO86802.1 hypothetical protein FM037_22010 [Shewanella psychropiezotolerans]
MVSQNAESAIALALAGSIEAYGKQLEVIQGWTNGGLPMFESAMRVMFDGFIKDGVSGSELEDLFQLAIMDYISHSSEYADLPPGMEAKMMHYLESTGSGSHGYHEGWDGTQFANETADIFNFMLASAPDGSLCHDILTYMKVEQGAPASLEQQYRNNFDKQGGFVGDANYPNSAGLSPMLRMALMAAYLDQYPDVTQDTIEMFLTASVGELDAYIINNTPGTDYTDAMDFLFKNDGEADNEGWREVTQNGHTVIDWFGTGLDAAYFKNMYTDFPPRELTDDDIKEVNRIGDQVKMIQQTLKYWIQISRDEQMAIARNI